MASTSSTFSTDERHVIISPEAHKFLVKIRYENNLKSIKSAVDFYLSKNNWR